MDQNPYAPSFDDLPESLPIFPLYGVLLLPKGQLPLNIFEPRYVRMVDDALKTHRMIGVIQPKSAGENAEKSSLYTIGCAGKITEFVHMRDGRYSIALNGICRFKIEVELDTGLAYRVVRPQWAAYQNDLAVKSCLDVDRDKLLELLRIYFEREGMSCDFQKIKSIEDQNLMAALAMVCPFEPNEKQALLEQPCCVERSKLLMTMLEMAICGGPGGGDDKKHWH
ncbi:MAG: LON peptidase substrate-binding domain-containing protein [Bdellovibrionales bacterium]